MNNETKDLKKTEVTPEEAGAILSKNQAEAEKILQDPDKLDKLLKKVEDKLKVVPALGDTLSYVPAFISMIKSYVTHEYRDVPVGAILSMIAALIYLASAVDLIPDVFPVIGFADDAAVIAACLLFVRSDIDEYIVWREKNVKEN